MFTSLSAMARGLSFRVKLLGLLFCVTFVALAAGLGLSVAGDVRLFRRETATAADNLATVLAEFSVAPLSFNDPGGARDVLSRLEKSNPALESAALYDEHGHLFASWLRPGADAACPEVLSSERSGFVADGYDAVCAVSHRSRTLGTVVARLSTRELDEKVRLYAAQTVLIFVCVLGLCIALAFRLQRILSGPILRLADAARAVSAQSDLSVRVRPEGRDEIGQLCDAFNLMLARLEARQHERDLATLRLQESEAKYRGIVQDQTELVFRLDAEGTLLFVNEAYGRYWERRSEDLVGTSFLVAVAPDDREEVRRQLTSPGANGDVVRLAYRVTGPDGGERWHECTWRFIAGHGGSKREIQGMARDITDLRRAEQEKKELARQLEHSHRLETIGTLAGGIAHDFNNILTPIVGHIELARDQVPTDSEVAEHLAIAGASAYRARDLIKSILTFGRHADPVRGPVRVQDVVTETLQLLGASVPRTIRLNTALQPDCPPVLANAVQIQQLVVNLCTNAAQAIGAEPGEIEIVLEPLVIPDAAPATGPGPGEYVKLTVADNGPGMSAAVRQRIFEPFFTTKASGEGTGLGLSVVHGIVTAHGGHITVESQPASGTRFTVLLPVTATTAAREAERRPAAPGGVGRILVVDDEPMIAAMAATMLTRLGHEVTTATHPDAALALFARDGRDFDLVITDQSMPGMSGTQLIALLSGISPRLRVIITSGYNRDRLEYDLPASVHLASILRKPYSMDELSAAVGQALAVGAP